MDARRTVVVCASSGLERSIGLADRGARVALLARREERLDSAAELAGPGTPAIACAVTDESSCQSAIDEAAAALGGIDAVVYAPGIGPLARLVDTSAQMWCDVFATNVTGAALITRAALPHLASSSGKAAYLSSVSASLTRRGPASARTPSAKRRSTSWSKPGERSARASALPASLSATAPEARASR